MDSIRKALTRNDDGEAGAISAEFVAIVILIAAIIAAVWAVGFQDKVRECGNSAKDSLFSTEDSEGGVTTPENC